MDLAKPTPSTSTWASLAPALRSRDFRLFWFGQIVSTIGTSLQVVAEGYLVYEITQSTFWLGMVNFIGLLPVIPIALLGGVLIDRVPRRKLILITQTGLMLQALVFGLLVVTGQIALPHIVVLYFVFGALLAIDHPARRALLVELVSKDDLANAVALNATIYNVASLVGYTISGFLIAWIGAGGTMLVNGATYLAPLLMLSFVRAGNIRHDTEGRPMKSAVSEGIRALLGRPNILGAISLMAVAGGLAWPVFGLMPAYAEEVIGVGAIGLGLLLASGALGSVIGTAVTARVGRHHRGRNLALASLLLPCLVVAVAYSREMWIACVFIAATGLVLLVVQSLAITLVQLHTPDRIRGRVMTVYSMLHAGADTGSNMVTGALAAVTSLPLALGLAGVIAFGYGVLLWLFLPGLRELE